MFHGSLLLRYFLKTFVKKTIFSKCRSAVGLSGTAVENEQEMILIIYRRKKNTKIYERSGITPIRYINQKIFFQRFQKDVSPSPFIFQREYEMEGFFTPEIQEKLNKIMSECEIEMPSDAIAYCIDQVYGRLDKFDWCHDCKEYDQEKHCCHRWSKVIRDTLAHIEPVKTCTVENVHPVGKYTFGDCECGAPVIMPDKYCSECGLKLEWNEVKK